jgi:hypothetical protein
MPKESESGLSPVTLADADVRAATDVRPRTGTAHPLPARLRAIMRGTVRIVRRRPPRWLAWPLTLTAAAIGLYIGYLHVSRTYPVASDGASNALQSWDMLHGNLLLSGWLLGHVSFYTTELPEYMIVEAIRGLHADVLHQSAAVTYTLLVLLAGTLARGRIRGREGVLRGLIAAGIMIAPQIGPGVFILLLQPDHVGTQVPLLATWLVLDRAQCLSGGTTPPVPPARARWYVPVLVTVLLAWAEVADGFALVIGAAPLAVVAIIRAYRALVQRREPLRSGWFDLSLIAAAALSAWLTDIVIKLIGGHGGYSVLSVPTGLASASQLPGHLWLLAEGVLGLYGADFLGMASIELAAAIAFLHLIGLALAAWALCRAIRRFFPLDSLVDQVLVTSILITAAAYVLSTIPLTYYSSRYLAGLLVGGAVLAGRMLAVPVLKARLVPALTIVLGCYLAAFGYTASQPSVPAVSQNLANWLAAHHLSYGLSSYGLANVTTLASGGAVHVLPVAWTGRDAEPGPSGFEQSWYDPQDHYANFVVLLSPPSALDDIEGSQVIGTFGPPQHVYSYDGYVIATYDINLLTSLTP